MSQKELWQKAAECTRAIDATGDPKTREMLTHLRTLWINLANDSQFLGAGALVEQIATVGRIHADLTQLAAK
jgi:hypothetical protein